MSHNGHPRVVNYCGSNAILATKSCSIPIKYNLDIDARGATFNSVSVEPDFRTSDAGRPEVNQCK